MNTRTKTKHPIPAEQRLLGLGLSMLAVIPLLVELVKAPLDYPQQGLYMPMLSCCFFSLWCGRYPKLRYTAILKVSVWSVFFLVSVWYGSQAVFPEYRSMPNGLYYVIAWVVFGALVAGMVYSAWFSENLLWPTQDRVKACLNHPPSMQDGYDAYTERVEEEDDDADYEAHYQKIDLCDEGFDLEEDEEASEEPEASMPSEEAGSEEGVPEEEISEEGMSEEAFKKLREEHARQARRAFMKMDQAYHRRKTQYYKNLLEELKYFKKAIKEGMYTKEEIRRIMRAFKDLSPDFRGF